MEKSVLWYFYAKMEPETDDAFKEELLDIVIDTGEYLDEVS